jgi:hypothetical protein
MEIYDTVLPITTMSLVKNRGIFTNKFSTVQVVVVVVVVKRRRRRTKRR